MMATTTMIFLDVLPDKHSLVRLYTSTHIALVVLHNGEGHKYRICNLRPQQKK